ncbi:hypothetical protein [Tissierella creatinophila]|uniref:Uncharacterized protein n=1 Tax=Tissierella creatinophila DSM 6911 TaxID=1123403 RepID=A0A1U7M5I6_TISCR|nr:hypothetical protein [Tissierella creatinophila]OLS02546.1 hypothetical protein TICRE_13470 [Tissierella creatinophila DSM 6911]
MGSAIRLSKGQLTTEFTPLYQVPNDRIAILKSIILTNLSDSSQTVSLKMAGAYIMKEKTLLAGESYQASVFDQVIVSGETIEGKASQGLDYYISGKLLLPQDIASETQWMQEQWDSWWATHPEAFEALWNSWLQSKTSEPDGIFYQEWKEWFDRIQEITHETADLVPWTIFRKHEESLLAHGELINTHRTEKDNKGIFTKIQWYRRDKTLAKESKLNGGNSPRYANRTVTYFEADGETIQSTILYKQIYNEEGDWIEEVIIDE